MSQVTVHPEARVMTLKCTHTDCNGAAKVPVSLAANAAVGAGEYDNLLSAIEACEEAAEAKTTVLHVLRLPERFPVWEIDRRVSLEDSQNA